AVQSLDGLHRIIATRHVAATIGQTGGSERAKMPETSNTDLHERAPRTQGWGRRPSSTRELSPGQPRPASADSLCRITLRCSEIELTESSPVRGGRPCPRLPWEFLPANAYSKTFEARGFSPPTES